MINEYGDYAKKKGRQDFRPPTFRDFWKSIFRNWFRKFRYVYLR